MSAKRRDQFTATLLVRQYLDAMGGPNNGHIVATWERQLIAKIAHELGRARAESSTRTMVVRPRRRRPRR